MSPRTVLVLAVLSLACRASPPAAPAVCAKGELLVSSGTEWGCSTVAELGISGPAGAPGAMGMPGAPGVAGPQGVPGVAGPVPFTHVVTFATHGDYTWAAPAGVSYVQVEVWGAGGGGGPSGEKGGGGGGYGKAVIQVTPEQSYPVLVGQGGAGAVAGSGESSSFNVPLVPADPVRIVEFVTATGGLGGAPQPVGQKQGGIAFGVSILSLPGAPGSSGSSGVGPNASFQWGGAGGAAGGGGGAGGVTSYGVGSNSGISPGGGGSGGVNSNGGDGADGQVTIWF